MMGSQPPIQSTEHTWQSQLSYNTGPSTKQVSKWPIGRIIIAISCSAEVCTLGVGGGNSRANGRERRVGCRMQEQLRAADSKDYPRRQVLAQNRCQNGRLGAGLLSVLAQQATGLQGLQRVHMVEAHGPQYTMGHPSTTAELHAGCLCQQGQQETQAEPGLG